MQVLCPASKFKPYTSTLALHCHQAAARAAAEKQRLAGAAAQREAEAAQLKHEQEAAAAAKAQHAAAVKSFFDEQVGRHKRLTDSFIFGLAACFGALLFHVLHLRDKLTAQPHWPSQDGKCSRYCCRCWR